MFSNIALTQVIILFLIILVGVYAKKRDIISKEANKKLTSLLLEVTAPLLVITSFSFDYSPELLKNAIIVFIFGMLIHGFGALIGMFLYKKYPVKKQQILKFVTTFSNCGFMGFPILLSLYGRIGIFYGSIFLMSFYIYIWSYGVMVFKGKGGGWKNIKKAFINPGMIAVYIGLPIFLFSIKLPTPLFSAMEMVGSMTSPLAMLIIGAILADVNFKSIFKGSGTYYASFIRLIVIPLIAFGVLTLLGLKGDILGICIILVAMPAAANSAIFAERLDGDAEYASKVVAVSTLLSVITIPFILTLL